MIALGAFLGWESIAGVGAIILFFGVLNLANSLSLYIGMKVCGVGCEVPAIILMSLIWALWDTFIGFGGFIVFLILFSKFTDAEIWPDAILTTVVTGFVQFFVFLAFIGIVAGLVAGLG